MKFIMGVDIGFVYTGISLFEIKRDKLKLKEVGLIKTEKSPKKKGMRVADDNILRITHMTQEFVKFYEDNVGEENEVIVFAESPTGGSKSATASRAMGIAIAIPAVIFEMLKLPVEYITPREVKVAVTGKPNASKDEIMEKVAKAVGEVVQYAVNSKSGTKYNNKYNVCDKKFGKDFEHIADSIGAVMHGKKHSQMYRIFISQNK